MTEASPEKTESVERKKPYGLLIVLGQKPHLAENKTSLELTQEGKMRLYAARELYRSGMTKKIMVSGGFTHGNNFPSEAQLMRDFLVNHLVPASDIVLEEESRTTTENIEKAQKLTAAIDGEIAFLSGASHVKRVEMMLKRAGVAASTEDAESVLRSTGSEAVTHFIDSLEKSPKYRLSKAKEAINRAILVIDSKDHLHTAWALLTRK